MVDVVKRVMIVDDSANVRQILQMSLVQAGYDVVEAIDGEDALRRFTENNVDMLVTDLKCFDFF
jgi:two-component system chemotaxis response regulator CheY